MFLQGKSDLCPWICKEGIDLALSIWAHQDTVIQNFTFSIGFQQVTIGGNRDSSKNKVCTYHVLFIFWVLFLMMLVVLNRSVANCEINTSHDLQLDKSKTAGYVWLLPNPYFFLQNSILPKKLTLGLSLSVVKCPFQIYH